MAYSTQRATSGGSMVSLDISILYLSRNDISVYYNGVPAGAGTWAWVGTTDKRITFSPAIANGVEVLIKRTTRLDQQINVFATGAKFNNATMDTNFTQVIYLNQEAVEGGQLSDVFNNLNMHGYKITQVGNAVADGDAVNYGQVKTMSNGAYTSAQAAAASAASGAASASLAHQWAMLPGVTVDGTNYSAYQYALNAGISAAAALGSQNAALTSQTASKLSEDTAYVHEYNAGVSERNAAASATVATTVAANVLAIQQNAQDAIDIANTFDGRLISAEANASNAMSTAAHAQADATNAVAIASTAGGSAHGQCRLVYVSGTLVRLMPFNGQGLLINGVLQNIPSAGVSMTTSGLASGTIYYVYATVVGGVMTLAGNTTGYSTASNGVVTMTGAPGSTLVGIVRLNGSGAFNDAANGRHVLSYFNRRHVLTSAIVNTAATTSATPVTLSNFPLVITWAGDVMLVAWNARVTGSVPSAIWSSLTLGGVDVGVPVAYAPSAGTIPVGFSYAIPATEGAQSLLIAGWTNAGIASWDGIALFCTTMI